MNESTEEAVSKDRIYKLERLVSRLTLENEFLKKGLQNSLSRSQRNVRLSQEGDVSSPVCNGVAGS